MSIRRGAGSFRSEWVRTETVKLRGYYAALSARRQSLWPTEAGRWPLLKIGWPFGLLPSLAQGANHYCACSNLLPHLLIGIDQSISRGVVVFHLTIPFQFRQNLFGQLFTQFDAPLVKAEDVPDNALHENLVFV